MSSRRCRSPGGGCGGGRWRAIRRSGPTRDPNQLRRIGASRCVASVHRAASHCCIALRRIAASGCVALLHRAASHRCIVWLSVTGRVRAAGARLPRASLPRVVERARARARTRAAAVDEFPRQRDRPDRVAFPRSFRTRAPPSTFCSVQPPAAVERCARDGRYIRENRESLGVLERSVAARVQAQHRALAPPPSWARTASVYPRLIASGVHCAGCARGGRHSRRHA